LKDYFAGIGFTKLDTVIVSQPKYMKALQTILSENNVSAWKEYMKWTLLNGSTGLLSSTVDAANFDFMERHWDNQTKTPRRQGFANS
jgi:endothelin-converting enzyme/putative endopeptidase